ncbi:S-adenosyl-L-methionine-dependent tRNA 4-demethylwyosine synthase [Candidatus Tiddalikarchaeum anstoanum]|nr:S-adenosyl-L-methionine-dependent tRNA 4-demethylwyosine synthase [Candidatus Tiddalikarchaeum anstoanum]
MDKTVYEKRRYKMVGSHSAVKLCTWTRNSLVGKGHCYKEEFYNVKSHRCLQMTPVVAWCEHSCLFCWRPCEFTQGTSMKDVKIDEPEDIINNAVEAQRKLLIGFKGNDKTPKKMYEEAINPNQAAISLAGEPTLYPKINGLLDIFKKKNFTTFLVTNGMNPKVLEQLSPLPTQLYITLVAGNPKDYAKITNSCYKEKGFQRLLDSINVMKSLNTRKVLRLTLVKDYNMKNPGEYAKIIENSGCDFVEAKAYMHVGSSIERLGRENMPSFSEIKIFSKNLADELGWKIIDEQEVSRVCLIAKEDYSWRKINKD